jgi:hypothetical protein
MVSGYSRWWAGKMIPTRNAEDLVLGQWEVLKQLGAVPRELVWDNESGVGRFGGAEPKLTREFTVLRGLLGTRVNVLRPRDPESKGMVERHNGFLETSFMPGRRFSSPTDFDTQFADWAAGVHTRSRRSMQGACAADRVGADRAAMTGLPPIDEAILGWRHSIRLPRDHYVRLDTCDYSVHPCAVGHLVEVVADLATVTIRRGGVVVGQHARCWARHQTITDPEHARAAAIMRQDYQDRRSLRGDLTEVACRDLRDYDRMFGVDAHEPQVGVA